MDMKIIALGDNVIDHYRNTGECFPGGNAVNVAVHAAMRGAEAEYMGNLGTDEFAGVITEALGRFRVSYDHCHILEGKKTKVCHYDVTDGERSFVSVSEGEEWAGPIRLEERDFYHLAGADLVACSCNAKIPEQVKAL